jgi:outer membrane protein OmpA-like peptidoglycan-associated protein
VTPSKFLTLLVLATLTTGCAATIPSELANARTAYQSASQGPAASLVPADLHKAHEALAEAETAFKDDPHGFHTKDLAYVAQRKAELAQALAVSASEQKSTANANSQYQATQDAIMLDTKAQLGASQSNLAASKSAEELTAERLAASQAAGADTAAQLSASENGRADAERRANDAMAALAKLAAVKQEARGLVITLSGSVLFQSDEATLVSGAQARLGEVADALLATKERSIIVEGHTDSQGSDEHNLDLSQRRADAVAQFLVQRGYEASRIHAVGIGESRPTADNATAEGRANNRRVEIVLQPAVVSAQ